MKRLHRNSVILGGLIGLFIFIGALLKTPSGPEPSFVVASPIPLGDLPAIHGPITLDRNLFAQVSGQIAGARFSSDPSIPPSTFNQEPNVRAFLYNSTPCIRPGDMTHYRLALYGSSPQPAQITAIHLAMPEAITLTSFSQPYQRYELETRSYYWTTVGPLIEDELFVINVEGIVSDTKGAQAHLIVTYTGLADEGVRHVVSTHSLAACDSI